MILSKKGIIATLLVVCFVVSFSIFADGDKSDFEVKNEFKIIKSSSFKKEGKKYHYELLRLEGKNMPAYAVYYPNKGAKEVVLVTMPYERIDWSGEEVDSHHWKPHTIASATESANLSLMNGFGVLLVYARFYQGGDIDNDVEDISAGLNFLENRSEKIGIYGGSWGGFEALYAATNSRVKPIVGVAFYPPSDFEKWLNWTYQSEERDFWEPYQKRAEAGSKEGFSRWSHEYIAKNLETSFLVVHAKEDSLVPFEQSLELANKTEKIDRMWLRKKHTRLSHGEPYHEEVIPMENMFSFVYLMSGLTDRELLMLLDKKAIKNYIDDLKILKTEGEDIVWSRLIFEKFFKHNLKYYDIETEEIILGPELKTEFQDSLRELGI